MIMVAKIMLSRLTKAPLDKSISPVRITNEDPKANIATTASCSTRFLKFPGEKNRLVVTVPKINTVKVAIAAGPHVALRILVTLALVPVSVF